jgi:aminoglycoside 6'-N-acetyltransferase
MSAVEAPVVEEKQGVDGVISWRPLAAGDLPMLTTWLREPQVARWWNHDTSREGVERDFGPSVRGEEPGEDLVVLLGGRPVGLLQRSRIGDYPEDLSQLSEIVDVPPGAVGIDYLIAEPALRGHGLGTRLITMAVSRTWTDYHDASAVIVPVVAANVASWRALEKAGLRRVAEGPITPDNPIDDPLHYVYRIDRPAPDKIH